VTSWAVSISFELFLGISAMKSTGAPILFTATHDLYCLNHFLPLLTTSYA
jgi:hypothetical protein